MRTLEDDFEQRAENLKLIEKLLNEMIDNKDNIKSIVIGILHHDDGFRFSSIGALLDRIGLVEVLKQDINDTWKEEMHQ